MSAPSLQIEFIEVENFKSYAGKHKIGPFHPTFTAVIGPNGSGKSNILDSLLFVFGKRANKIRLDKLGELIHSSTAFPNCDRASVTVVFRTKENTQIRLTREVHKGSNTTQYYIDGKKQSQTVVVTYLKEHGIDLDHNRFLILQGEVEQIALMKPKAEKEGEEGFLEYLDDLIGTNKYVDGIKRSTEKMIKLQDECRGTLEKTHKLGKERDLLEDGKNAAVTHVRKENQFYKIISLLCQHKIQRAEDQAAPHRDTQKALEEDMKKIEEKNDNIQAQQEENGKNIAKYRKLMNGLEKERDAIKDDIDEVDTNISEIRTRMDDSDRQNKKSVETIKKNRDEVKKITMRLEDIERDKKISQNNAEEARTRLARQEPEFERQAEALQGTTRPIREAIDAKLRDLAPWEDKYRKASELVVTLQEKHRLITERAGDREKQFQEDQQKVTTLTESVRDLKGRLQTVQGEGASAPQLQGTQTVAEIEKELNAAVRRKAEINAHIESLKASVQSANSEDKVATFLSGTNLAGYYGVLRQLGTIDEQYDIAAGVAGGGFWGHHIVEDEKVASEAIKLLKDNNVGRASFLALKRLNEQDAGKCTAAFTAPAESKRLYDLIRPCDEKYRVAFYTAVRDTLVTANLTVARKYGLSSSGPRYRCVTVTGEIVEPSGQVTGGGQAKPQGAGLRGGGGSRKAGGNPRQELEKLQTELQKAHAEVLRLTDQMTNRRAGELQAGRHMEATRAKVREIQVALDTASIELRTAERNLAESKRAHEESSHELRSGDLNKLVKDIDHAQKQRDAINKDRSRFLQDKEALERQLNSVGGEAFQKLRQQVEADKAYIKEFTNKLEDSVKVEREETRKKNNLMQKIAELENNMSSSEVNGNPQDKAQYTEFQKKKEALEKKLKAKDMDLDDAKQKKETAEKQERELKDMGLRESEKYDRKKSEYDTVQSQIDAIMAEVQKFTDKLKEAEEKTFNNLIEFGDDVIVFDGEDLDPEQHATRIKQIISQGCVSLKVNREELRGHDPAHLKYLYEQLNQEVKNTSSTLDLQSIKRWKEKDIQWREAKAVHDTIHSHTVDAEKEVAELKETRKTEFMKAFEDIRNRLKSLYQMLTQGGDADLELVDAHDPFEGINFSVRPPRKSWKQISQLSGGEKTLSSLSLVFALHHFKPTPLYIMDEIDAALDFRNVSIVARYVTMQTIQAQFIIVSLRNSMFEMASQLVGVCKVKDCTQSIALNPGKVKELIETRTGKVVEGGEAVVAPDQQQPRPKRANSPDDAAGKRRKK
eukprot:PhF_6_TR29360/c1_g1_i1/m.43194/K06675/SMC4; structural maintenance of chromosome 4